jgi:excisionase family DNA binding protein
MDLLTTQQAAELLGMKKSTLNCWRAYPAKDPGLSFVRIGGAIRYEREVVLAFIAARRVER